MSLVGRYSFPSGVVLLVGDFDPRAGSGVIAPRGSLFLREGATVALFQKTGANDTDWSVVSVGASGLIAVAGGGVSTAIDFAAGPSQQLTLSSSSTNLILNNPDAGKTYTLAIVQSVGGQAVVWPAAVKWPGGVVPTLSAGAGAKDLFRLYYDGTIYYAVTVGLAFA